MTENINETDITVQPQESSEAENTTAEDTSTSDSSEAAAAENETYTIGQIFLNTYPPEAAIWCNNQGNCHIEETDPLTEQTQEGETITTKRYEIKANPVPTTEELAQQEAERVAMLKLTAADVERAIYKAKGMDFEDVVALVEQYNQTAPLDAEGQSAAIDIKALKIELKANNFYRGNPYINAVGTLLGFTSDQLDNFFETRDYTTLLT